MYKEITEVDYDDYVVVRYEMMSNGAMLDEAVEALAIGQSVGNPNMRSCWETPELFENHGCIIIGNKKELSQKNNGTVLVGFPVENIDFTTDGIAHLLVNIMGGQLDINIIRRCRVIGVGIPEHIKEKSFLGPKYGIKGVRKFTGVEEKPLLGAIMKPKTGVSPDIMLEMVKALVDGGVNFIKEDEILSSPHFCDIDDRVPLIMNWLNQHAPQVVYSVSIHSDPSHLLYRVNRVHQLGGNSVHVNFWCGLGAYKSIREMMLPIMVHLQKSGDKILTNRQHDFSIAWPVLCKIIGMSGVDFAHAGMLGGYYKGENETWFAVQALRDQSVMPALSCGLTADHIAPITDQIGMDWMANAGGSIHSHEGGSTEGALAIRNAIDAL